MASRQKRVLITGMPVERAAVYEEQLVGRDFAVEVIPDASTAVERIEAHRYQAVVAAYPLPPGELGRLMVTLRTRRGLNATTGLLLIAPRASLRAAAGMVGRGVTKALSEDEDPMVLGIVVERIVQFTQPTVERLPLRLPVSFGTGTGTASCRTENLSGGGMLVGCDQPPYVGAVLDFSIHAGDGLISGRAKVVRHTVPGREPVDGFGARFISFDDDGRDRLVRLLASERDSLEASA